MRAPATLRITDPSKTLPDDRRRITICVIAVQAEPAAVIELVWLKTGIPEIIVRWKLGLYHWTGIAAVGFVAPRGIIRALRFGTRGTVIIWTGIIRPRIIGPLLVQGPVTAGKRRRDQDKLDTGGLFHIGVAVKRPY
jgi:hypothetical protein